MDSADRLSRHLSRLNEKFYEHYPRDYFGSVLDITLVGLTAPGVVVDTFTEEREIPGDDGQAAGVYMGHTEDVKELPKAAKVLVANLYHHALETLLRLFIAHAPDVDSPWLALTRMSSHDYHSRAQRIAEIFRTVEWTGDNEGDDHVRAALVPDAVEPTDSESTMRHLSIAKSWIRVAAEEAGDPFAYNAWKHGLSVQDQMTKMGLVPHGDDAPVIEEAGNVIATLTRKKKDDGYIYWTKEERFLRVAERIATILVAQAYITAIVDVGRARFAGPPLGVPPALVGDTRSDLMVQASGGRMRIAKVLTELGLRERRDQPLEAHDGIEIRLEMEGVDRKESEESAAAHPDGG